jgi:hypothetical protein
MRRACAALRDKWASQQEMLGSAGYQADAVVLTIEEVLLEELESWFE